MANTFKFKSLQSKSIIGGAGAFTTLTANNGTVTTSTPALTVTQTLNGANTSVVFNLAEFSFTNTTSSVNSTYFTCSTGGVTHFAVRRSGSTIFVGDIIGSNGFRAIGNANSGGQVILTSNGYYCWNDSTTSTFATQDLLLRRDAAGTLAQYNGINPQEYRLYGTWLSSTNYQRMNIKAVRQVLTPSGASVTTTGTFIPVGAVVVGVTTRTTATLTGASGYQVGDGTDADRWGDITGTSVGTVSDNRNWTVGTIECFTAGGEVTLTAKTSNFTGGSITICVFYLAGEAD